MRWSKEEKEDKIKINKRDVIIIGLIISTIF
jgi:preprotein translocase subunit Sec61beta